MEEFMNDDNTSAPAVKKSSRWRKLGWLAAVLLVFLVIAYFVVTSSGFLKSVVLPRVSKALNAQVTVDQISLHPFSGVDLRQLKVQAPGYEPLLQADEVGVRYSLWDIIRGNIYVKDIKLVRPVVQVVEDATGKNNLAPLLATEKKPGPSAPPKPSLTQLRLDKLELSQGSLRWIQNGSNGQQLSAEISGLNLTLGQLGNNEAGKVDIAAQVKVAQRASASAPVDQLSASLSGGFQFKLDPALKPVSVEGKQRLAVAQAEGAWREFASLGAQLDCQMTPTEVRTLSCQFERQGEKLGQLRISGPLDLAKNEGRLRLEIHSLDRQVLNVVGAMGGWDFGDSQINSTNQVAIENQGNVIAADGNVRGTRLTLGQKQVRTPEIDVDFAYQFTWTVKAKTLLLQRLGLTGMQKGKDFLSLSLERPMNLSWGDNRIGFKESTLVATVTNLNLADWRVLSGLYAPEGLLNLETRTRAQQDGRQLSVDLKAEARGLKVAVSNRLIEIPQFQLTAQGRLDDYERATLDRLQFEAPGWFRGDASGNYNDKNKDAAGRFNIEANPVVSLQKWPVPNMSITNGNCKVSVLYTSRLDNQQTIRGLNGSLALIEMGGRYDDLALDNYQLDIDYDATLRDNIIEIKKFNVAPRHGFDRGGSLDLSGTYHRANHQANINLTLLDLNQNALTPLRPSVAALASVPSFSLNATANLLYQPAGSNSIKADLALSNLVITNGQNKTASPPLGLKAKVAAGLTGSIVELRQCLLDLGATAKATNEVSVQGRLDQSNTNALAGQLKIQADALDLTAWYQSLSRLSGSTNALAATPAATPVAAAPANPTEPPAATLPLNPFTVETKIGQLYLGDLVITNLQANVKLANNEVTLDPFQMQLNGAPVKGLCKVNLGVPGYIYDLSFQVDKAPLEPMVNTFMPEYRGKYKGDVNTLLQLKGAGTTGVNLKKNLSGQMQLVITNTSVSILEPSLAKVLTFIPVVGKTLSSMSSSLLSTVATKLSLPELQQSAINALIISMTAGKGAIDLQKMLISSPAFQIDSVGRVLIADNLPDSTMNQPISLALSRNLAQKIKLADSTETNSFVALPAFIKASGTLGQPKQEYDYVKLAQLGTQVAAGFLGNTEAGNILKGISNLNKPVQANTNTAATGGSTNAAGTTATRVENMLGTVGALLGETNRTPAGTVTNQPALTNQAGSTNRVTVTNQAGATTNQAVNTNAPANSKEVLIKEGLNLLPSLLNSSKTNK
jgi:hypothetical protein